MRTRSSPSGWNNAAYMSDLQATIPCACRSAPRASSRGFAKKLSRGRCGAPRSPRTRKEREMDDAPSAGDARLARGYQIEGWAFTFCKAAFLALIFERYTLLATAAIGTALYLVAAGFGVREW